MLTVFNCPKLEAQALGYILCQTKQRLLPKEEYFQIKKT
jgi:hypothetical protein